MKAKFIKATPCDISRINQIYKASFPGKDQGQDFGSLIFLNDVSVTIAELPEDDVSGTGFVITRTIRNESEIIMLCVKPEHRREGLATLLMIDVIDKAITSGVKHIFLEVSEDNYKAKSMYKKLGFKNVGTRKKYYTSNNKRSDAIVKKLSLDEKETKLNYSKLKKKYLQICP